MRCPKCRGQMAYERFLEFSVPFGGWRCVNCGEIIDAVILENRRENARRTA